MGITHRRPRVRVACSLALAVCLTTAFAASALDRGKALIQLQYDVWSSERGLPQISVQDLHQTRDGFLWIGTQEGLVRFDGARFEVFDSRNTPAIENNLFIVLLEAEDGSLWCGTHGGLLRYDGHAFSTFTSADGLAQDIIHDLAEDQDGAVWVGTESGLARYQDGTFQVFTTEDGLPSNMIMALLVDARGTLWVGTRDGGVVQLLEEGFVTPPHLAGVADSIVASLFQDASGAMWIGTQDRGLIRADGHDVRQFGAADGLTSSSVITVYEDRDEGLWVGTYDGGLCRLEGEGFCCFTRDEGLAHQHITTIHEDREGSLWFGSLGGGLNRLRDATFASYTTAAGLSHPSVWAILEGSRGLWVGTDDGLNLLVDGDFVDFEGREETAGDSLMAIHEDGDGTLWTGLYGGGLRRLRQGQWQSYTTADGLVDDQVYSITRGPDGALWIGTRSGISRLDDGRFTTYTTADGLPADDARVLHFDHRGELWIGTHGGGIARYQDGRFVPFVSVERPTPNQAKVYAIHEDSGGDLWFGTLGGLIHHSGGTSREFTVEHGLFDDTVYAILEDEFGYLWVSCNRGIYRVSKSALADLAAGKLETVDVDVFGQDDGMPATECNGGSQPSAWKTHEGRLWFSTAAGVASVDPGAFKRNPHPPSVHVERVLVDNREVDPDAGLVMRAGAKRLEVHYTATSFVAPQRVRFQTELEGFDDGWMDAGSLKVVQYTNLPPGEYTFRVNACNADGIWSERGASFLFTKKPYIYQMWGFYLVCGLIVLAVLVGLYTVRLRQLERRQAELEHEVETRSRQLVEARNLLAEARHLPIRFGPYTLVSILGEGGMARVYRAVREGPKGFRKELAVKRIRTDLTRDNESLVQSLIDEARLGGQLKHPHVVDVYELGSVSDQYYIAMEYVAGWTLDALITGATLRGIRLPLGAALDLMLQTADGLAHAHALSAADGRSLNLVHRDLKPSNILVSTAGQAKIMDFGIARSRHTTAQATMTDVVKGTPRFMSPEQLQNPRGIDHRSDLFAFGCILFEVLVGDRLITGDSIQASMWQIISGRYRDRLGRAEQVVPAALPILDRCLQPEPDQRYDDARQLGDDLRELRRGVDDPLGSKELVELLVAWVRRDGSEVDDLQARITQHGRPGAGWEVFVRALGRDIGGGPDPYVLPRDHSVGPSATQTVLHTEGSASEHREPSHDAPIAATDTTVLWTVDDD
jgi:ligand-binding sensor domain-containing protein/serine/threonine protein kinase